MTNAEKYKEVFGMNADPSNCPSSNCIDCPCAQRNVVGDILCFDEITHEWWNKEYKEAYQTGYEEGKNDRPKGHWIRRPQGHYVCSLCEKGMYKSDFCPSCGADMRGDKE